jgi:hypothetical protein
MSVFDRMWDAYDEFRRAMYVTNYLWAALFLAQAAGTALIIANSTYSTAYDFDQILPFAATGLGIAGSLGIGRYYTRRGRAKAAAAGSGAAGS